MRNRLYRLGVLALSLLMVVSLAAGPGRASSSSAYFTAVNDQLLDLNDETMPFYSSGVLYVSSRLFEGTDLGVSYSRNTSLGLATLYSRSQDLHFDLAGQIAYDKQNNLYTGYAIERGGVVFFPLNLVCRYFGLNWSSIETDYFPVIRVKSENAVLSDSSFAGAASTLIDIRYNEYTRASGRLPVNPNNPNSPAITTPDPPVVQAAEGQKIYLLFDGGAAGEVLPVLEDIQATFLLSEEQMADGDLLRGLVAGGHGVALRLRRETAEEAEEELRRGREALWQAACCRLELAWNDGGEDLTELLEVQGCVEVRADLEGGGDADGLLRTVGQYREDVAVYMGEADDLAALEDTLTALEGARYRLSAWRLTA